MSDLQTLVQKWRLDPKTTKAQIFTDQDFRILMRIRPLLQHEVEAVESKAPARYLSSSTSSVAEFECLSSDNGVVYVHQEDDAAESLTLQSFPVHGVYNDAQQLPSESFYNNEVQSHIRKILYSGEETGDIPPYFTILAYGQTGSGKTYSCIEILEAASADFVNRLCELKAAATTETPSLVIRVSIYELVGENCYDLLGDSLGSVPGTTNDAKSEAEADIAEDEGSVGVQPKCAIREDQNGRVHVKCSKVEVTDNLPFLLGLVGRAMHARRSSSTKRNHGSSRSHAFCNFQLVHKGSREAVEEKQEDEVVLCTLRIVDLAGNERWEDATEHGAKRIAEMKQINGSLGNLKECVRLAMKNDKSNGGSSDSNAASAAYVPYRRSKLTLLLRDLFDSNRASLSLRCLLISHLSPLRSSLKHSLNTLRFCTSITEKDDRASLEQKSFAGPLAWSAATMRQWVRKLHNGKYAFLADSFYLTGKLFSVEWIGHVQRRSVAAGGTEDDGSAIYDAYHEELSKFKASKAKSFRKSAAAGAGSAAVDFIKASVKSGVDHEDDDAGGRSKIANSARGAAVDRRAERAKLRARFAESFNQCDTVVFPNRPGRGATAREVSVGGRAHSATENSAKDIAGVFTFQDVVEFTCSQAVKQAVKALKL